MMMAARIYDESVIESVLREPAIFEAVREDDCFELLIDVENEAWVEISVNGLMIGLYNIHPHNATTCEIHAHILPEYRKKHSMDSGKCILKWFLDTKYHKLIAQVPTCHENVIRFCEAQGFKQEGVNRLSYKKNGKIIDQVMLGMTREEIKAAINE